MSLPPQLEIDLQALNDEGFTARAVRDVANPSRIFVLIEKYPVPNGWNKKQANLLLLTDISYPNSKLDMFWTDVDFFLKDGRTPQAGNVVETYMNKQWRRFSWHVRGWNPAVDNLKTYLGTIDARLSQAQ